VRTGFGGPGYIYAMLASEKAGFDTTAQFPEIASPFGIGLAFDQPAIMLNNSDNIGSSGQGTTALLTPPSGKTTADFTAGRIQDDEKPRRSDRHRK
jgi:hypothetical protein